MTFTESTEMFLVLSHFVTFVLPGCSFAWVNRLKMNRDEADGINCKDFQIKVDGR